MTHLYFNNITTAGGPMHAVEWVSCAARPLSLPSPKGPAAPSFAASSRRMRCKLSSALLTKPYGQVSR
jgi:hypothetical protein